MNGVVTKAIAEIQPGADDSASENGTFEVILSAETEDRDGDTLKRDEWKTPLPDHITFDTDHGMSVAATVGSGVPRIESDGTLRVAGSYSSIPRGQEIRTLVNEGHIRTTSVAFMTEKSSKAAGGKTTRELLNGAFVAVPSNREAVVLSSKGFDAMERETRTVELLRGRQLGTKSIVGSVEALQDRVSDALDDAYGTPYGYWGWLRGCIPNEAHDGGTAVFQSSCLGDPDIYDSCTYSQDYTDDGNVVTLTGAATEVDIHEIVAPDADADRESKSLTVSDPAASSDPAGSDTDGDEVDVQLRAAAIRANTALL